MNKNVFAYEARIFGDASELIYRAVAYLMGKSGQIQHCIKYITEKSHRFKVYVANRVVVILDYTVTGDQQNIDGKMNPADICIQPNGLMDPANLLQQDKNGKLWLLGPDFLTEKYQASNLVIDEID